MRKSLANTCRSNNKWAQFRKENGPRGGGRARKGRLFLSARAPNSRLAPIVTLGARANSDPGSEASDLGSALFRPGSE